MLFQLEPELGTEWRQYVAGRSTPSADSAPTAQYTAGADQGKPQRLEAAQQTAVQLLPPGWNPSRRLVSNKESLGDSRQPSRRRVHLLQVVVHSQAVEHITPPKGLVSLKTTDIRKFMEKYDENAYRVRANGWKSSIPEKLCPQQWLLPPTS